MDIEMAKSTGLPLKKAEGSKTPVPVKIVSEINVPATDKDWEAEERKRKAKYALEDIERAEGHKRDKALMKEVKAVAKEKMASLKKIC